MSTKSTIKIIFFAILFSVESYLDSGKCPAQEAYAHNLQQKIAERLTQTVDEGYLRGFVDYIDSNLNGIIYVGEKIDGKIGGFGGFFQFSPDSISGEVVFPYLTDTITVELNSRIWEDSLSGIILLTGKHIYSHIKMSGVQDKAGRTDLFLDVNIIKLSLSGSLTSLFYNKDVLFNQIASIAQKIGFDNISLNITGQQNLFFRNLDIECNAIVHLKISFPGYRKGELEIENGSIYKFGRKFKINGGIFDFESGQIFITADYAVDTYIISEDRGSVRRRFLVTAEYTGSLPDSAQWEMTSSPALSEEQIDYLLITGDPYSPETATFFSANLEDRVKNTLQLYRPEKYTRLAERQVGKLAAFDRVVIEGNAFSTEGSTYSASKNIAGKLSFRFRGTLGAAANQSVAFEYPLSRRLYLINETNQYGKTGVDIRYIVKFK